MHMRTCTVHACVSSHPCSTMANLMGMRHGSWGMHMPCVTCGKLFVRGPGPLRHQQFRATAYTLHRHLSADLYLATRLGNNGHGPRRPSTVRTHFRLHSLQRSPVCRTARSALRACGAMVYQLPRDCLSKGSTPVLFAFVSHRGPTPILASPPFNVGVRGGRNSVAHYFKYIFVLWSQWDM